MAAGRHRNAVVVGQTSRDSKVFLKTNGEIHVTGAPDLDQRRLLGVADPVPPRVRLGLSSGGAVLGGGGAARLTTLAWGKTPSS